MKTRLILGFSGLLLVGLDQWVKWWARNYLQGTGPRVLIEGVFGFRYATNTGAAFGILAGGRWFFVILTVAVLAAACWLDYKTPLTRRNLWVRIPMTAFLAGALGNFLDRLRLGYVVDMFQFLFINFPIFNVADVLLVSGTIAFGIATLFILKEEELGNTNKG